MSKEMARKYEVAWNQLFYEFPEWKQKLVIEEPHGRHSGELASLAAILAEHGKLSGHEKYNNLGAVEFKMPASGVNQ